MAILEQHPATLEWNSYRIIVNEGMIHLRCGRLSRAKSTYTSYRLLDQSSCVYLLSLTHWYSSAFYKQYIGGKSPKNWRYKWAGAFVRINSVHVFVHVRYTKFDRASRVSNIQIRLTRRSSIHSYNSKSSTTISLVSRYHSTEAITVTPIFFIDLIFPTHKQSIWWFTDKNSHEPIITLSYQFPFS